MRSYSACLTCKRRKLKCDESKPACGNCIKASRDCAYGERSIFRSQKIGSSPGHKRKRDSAWREQQSIDPRDHNTWVELPAKFTFVHVDDPWDAENSTFLTTDETVLDEELGDKNPRIDEENHVLGRREASHSAPAETSSPCLPSSISHYTPREDSRLIFQSNQPDIDPSENVIVSYLLRHFKQGPGQWMDLFDTTAYFSSKVPVLATSKTLLKSAVCALSAKHLRHICRVRSQGDDTPANIPRHIALPWVNEEMWQYNSAKYYDQALGHLQSVVGSESYSSHPLDKEEMLAAVAILCAFELMDAPGSAWKAHLSALPLFHDKVPSETEHPSVVIPQTAIKGPIFWSLARQDLLCAFVSESQTRLNLKDMRLWQNAGLATDENGDLLPYSPSDVMENQNSLAFEEDMKSNELTWILGKIANHLTAGDALAAENNSLPRQHRLSIGWTQEHLLERWRMLMTDLDRWHDSLPPFFSATARTRRLGRAGPGLELSFDIFEQIWFDLPLAAATKQSYHQARILLLANEPQESTALRSTVSARLRSYRHSLAEVVYHAREICGISLANPTDPFRVNSVQALFVAGQVFQDRREQDAVLEILSGIERDLGWTTRYHVAKLTDEWAKGREGNHVDRDNQSHDSNWFIV